MKKVQNDRKSDITLIEAKFFRTTLKLGRTYCINGFIMRKEKFS
ncbi:hypothetical protein [Ruminococcus albus]|nr:hypothetical protein [Ruminococcus albus]